MNFTAQSNNLCSKLIGVDDGWKGGCIVAKVGSLTGEGDRERDCDLRGLSFESGSKSLRKVSFFSFRKDIVFSPSSSSSLMSELASPFSINKIMIEN